MDNFNVYKDIQARTKGEIYIGVVGPVRTGKSTFIKRFMELAVLPAMEDESLKAVSTDELPQSAGGKTVMTTEPKFIPKEAVQITLGDGIQAKVRLIDCVGYMVDGAAGHVENGEERMVKTPWSEKEIPFTQAAQIGTRKVIGDHSTIGIVVTTDGSVGELKRSAYIDAEKQTVDELKKLGKPFILLLNSTKPYSDETLKLAEQLAADGISARVLNIHTIKPLDVDLIAKAAAETGLLITVEEHSIIGGLGAAVAEAVCDTCPVPVVRIGVNDEYGHSGPAVDLLKEFGLCAEHIVEVTKASMAKKA